MSDMKYIVESRKTINQATTDLEESVKRNHFGVLHVHNLKETLNSKGVDFAHECRVLEVCNPHRANEVLASDMSMNMALPCRISVWEEGGTTRIGMINPTAMLAMLSDSADLLAVAKDVEETTVRIIDEAR